MAKKKASDCGEIRATRIVLVDGSGKERIVMQLENGQPSISLFGLNGNVQVQFGIDAFNDNSAELRLASPDAKTIGRFVVIGDPTQEGTASLMFGGGYKRFFASTNLPKKLPSLDLTDEAGKTVAHLPTPNLKSKTKVKPKSAKAETSKVTKKN